MQHGNGLVCDNLSKEYKIYKMKKKVLAVDLNMILGSFFFSFEVQI